MSVCGSVCLSLGLTTFFKGLLPLPPLPVPVCFCLSQSVFIRFCPFLSFFVSIRFSQFPSNIICFFPNIVHFCWFLSVAVNFCSFLFIFVCFCLFLSVFVCSWLFLSVSVYFCLFLSVPGHFCLSVSDRFYQFLFVSVRLEIFLESILLSANAKRFIVSYLQDFYWNCTLGPIQSMSHNVRLCVCLSATCQL